VRSCWFPLCEPSPKKRTNYPRCISLDIYISRLGKPNAQLAFSPMRVLFSFTGGLTSFRSQTSLLMEMMAYPECAPKKRNKLTPALLVTRVHQRTASIRQKMSCPWSQLARQLTPRRGTVAHLGNLFLCVHIHRRFIIQKGHECTIHTGNLSPVDPLLSSFSRQASFLIVMMAYPKRTPQKRNKLPPQYRSRYLYL